MKRNAVEWNVGTVFSCFSPDIGGKYELPLLAGSFYFKLQP